MDYGPAPESADAALQWLSAQHKRFGLFINGQWSPASSHFETRNPATGKSLAKVGQGSKKKDDPPQAAAAHALDPWQKLGSHGRARHLYALARGLQKHSRLFAVLECLDNGKPIRETRDIDIPLAIRHFYHHAGWAQLLDSEFAGHRAIGVVGQIVPWNFPLLMLAWKIAPALACGNTVVFKPAEFTPLTALLFAHVCSEVGLPPGVVNIVTGDGDTGQAIVAHPGIGKIAFTGSSDVGRQIREATAGSGNKIILEHGGK
jgi:aldehyde dehydrogenase (NAD+)